jgi:hypothetical protein
MCKFFSFLSDGHGSYIYADWNLRKKILKGDIKYDSNQGPDSHSWLAKHFVKNGAEDKYNKYEYNPLTKVFTIDQINGENDSLSAEKWCNEIDWKRIVKPLNLKPIIHPLYGQAKTPTKLDRKLAKECASVVDSVVDSVGSSVMASVVDSVGSSVWSSVMASVVDSVGSSVMASVVDSVGSSVWSSVGSSIATYTSSFFDITYNINTTPSNRLWERGFILSFDGTTYRLHSGAKATIVWEFKK